MDKCEFKLYDEIGCNQFNFNKNEKIKLLSDNETYKSYFSEDEHKYFYLSKGYDNKITNTNNTINIEEEYLYKIELNGYVESSCDFRFYIITNINDDKILENLTMGKSKIIAKMDKNQVTKFAIRISGSGKFRIDSIKIYRALKVNYFNKKDLCKLIDKDVKVISDLKIACILDSLTCECLKDSCNLIKITPYTWKEEVEFNRPNLLLVESAWHGNDDAWNKKIEYINKYNIQELKKVIQWCNENYVPTVFWNKEDPVHYDNFIETSKLFDYVFTTDEGCLDRYKGDLGHNNVYTLPFAAQPKIHNPIKIYDNKIEKACFAGSYYNKKYPERKDRLDTILDIAIESIGLDIYDRNYNKNLPQYNFPSKFQNNVIGFLPINQLEKVNKGYKIVLNVNTVDNSKTMFSRRIYEVLACGTPVVSTYSTGIEDKFGDIVVCSDDKDKLKAEIIKLKQDDYYYDKKSIKGIRKVLESNTYEDRLIFVLDKLGINIEKPNKNIMVLSIINDKNEYEKIYKMYENQVYEDKKILFITYDQKLYYHVKNKCKKDEYILFYDLNIKNKYLKDIIHCDYVSVFNYNNYYGKYYLSDLINATLYIDAEFIGKKSYFKCSYDGIFKNPVNLGVQKEDISFQYTKLLYLDRSIFKSSILNDYKIIDLLKRIDVNNIKLLNNIYRYFSIDKYNFIEGMIEINSEQCEYVEI